MTSRRHFIGKVSAGVAGTIASMAPASRILGANDRIRLGIIGAGSRGQELMRQALACPNTELAAVADVYSRRHQECRAFVPEARMHFDYREMLPDRSIDAVLIATPQHVARAQEVADAALTLVRDNGRVFPLAREGTKGPALAYGQVAEAGTRVLVIIFTDDLRLETGHRLEREVRSRVPDADVQYVDLRTAAAMTSALVEKAARAEKVVVALYIAPTWAKQIRVGGELKNSVSLGDASAALLRALLEAARDKTAVVSLGSPYVITGFPGIQTYLCTYSSVSSSELSAVKALFGEMPIQGSLPVTIPNIAARGAGIRRPALSAGKMTRRSVSP